jgi:peptide deformylase
MIIRNIEDLRQPIELANLEEGLEIINQLEKELANEHNGIGLAAPQIGIRKKVAIIRFKDYNINLINPTIIERKRPVIIKSEGCLSLPGMLIDTQRYKEVFVKDLQKPEGFVGIGDIAIVLQHEIDHFEGILIIDRGIGKNKVKRNSPCPCGSEINGKTVKFKKCHGKT